MVLFWPVQQELDCINGDGKILGKIKFNISENQYEFLLADDKIILSGAEEEKINERLNALQAGSYQIPMQDDD